MRKVKYEDVDTVNDVNRHAFNSIEPFRSGVTKGPVVGNTEVPNGIHILSQRRLSQDKLVSGIDFTYFLHHPSDHTN